MADNNNGLYNISIGDPKYSCKLINQPLIRFQGRSSYSFSYSDTIKTGLYDNCRSSGIFYGNNISTYNLHNFDSLLTTSKFVPDKKNINIEVKDDHIHSDELIRLPVPDVDSVNPFLIGLVQSICVNNEDDKLTKFSDAYKWCSADLPDVLKENPIHPDHLLDVFKIPKDEVFTCKGCNFPVNGFGFKCTECSDYNICVRCASLPGSILHEAHKHPLVLSSSKDVKCAACCSDVYGATFTCDECGFAIHGTCALLPRSIKHWYDQLHPFVLMYTTRKKDDDYEDDEDEDPSSQPFCEFCEKYVNHVKGNEGAGWLYHCPDCDMFGCIQCFAMDLDLLCQNKKT